MQNPKSWEVIYNPKSRNSAENGGKKSKDMNRVLSYDHVQSDGSLVQ